MLVNAKTLAGFKLNCVDGEIGTVRDYYFDDKHWAVRYLVADTGTWLTERQVLISPYSVVQVDTGNRSVTVKLSKTQIESSPPLPAEQPLTRQYERDFFLFYGWPFYWTGLNMGGQAPFLTPIRDRDAVEQPQEEDPAWDPDLRSMDDIRGHHIQASDGELGHLDDFIVDIDNWAIRYLVIDTRNWWPGKRVLISPKWVEAVSWSESKIYVDIPRETIKLAPEYTPDLLLTRDYENALHSYYGRKGYWIEERVTKARMM